MPISISAIRDVIASALAGYLLTLIARYAPGIHVSHDQLAQDIIFGGGVAAHLLHSHAPVIVKAVSKVDALIAKAERLAGPAKPPWPIVTSAGTPGTSTTFTVSQPPSPVSAAPTSVVQPTAPAPPGPATPPPDAPRVQ